VLKSRPIQSYFLVNSALIGTVQGHSNVFFMVFEEILSHEARYQTAVQKRHSIAKK